MPIRLGICALLGVATLLVFLPVREHSFVDSDDVTGIVENADLVVSTPWEALSTAFTTTLNANWVPLTVLSLQLDRTLHGAEPAGFLLTNVALHAVAAMLLFVALLRLGGRVWPAAFVAGVFALHPLHVESVAWASMRKDSLSAIFWMLALWGWARYAERPGIGRYALVLACFGLGLLAKPIVITLPFVLLLLDFWPLGRLGNPGPGSGREWRRALLEKLPLFILAAAAGAVTWSVQAQAGAISPGGLSPTLRVWNALLSYAIYLRQAVWPQGLAAFYPHPAGTIDLTAVSWSAALLIALSVAAYSARRTRPYLLVGWLWFLGTLVPVIGLIQVGSQAHADRYTYLPLVGLAVAVAWWVADFARERRAPAGLVAVAGCTVLLVLGVGARGQLAYWRDASALHARAAAVTEANAIALHRLADSLVQAGQTQQAEAAFRRAIRAGPRRALPYIGLGDLLAKEGRLEEARENYEIGLELEPRHARGQANLGMLLVRMERFDAARPHLERAFALLEASRKAGEHPVELAAPHIALADVLCHQGDLDGAIAHYQRALAIDGERTRPVLNLGIALARAGRYGDARPLLLHALRTRSGSPELQATLGLTFAGLNQPRAAVHHYRNALLLKPGWRPAVNDLAWILATTPDPELRDPDQAVRLLESVRLDPEPLAALLDTLAAAYAASGRFAEAVETADQALLQARHDPVLSAAIRARRELYRAGQPYRAEAAPG